MDADGDFVIAWESLGQDGSYYGIYAQRYSAAGVAQGGEFRVNTQTTNTQALASVAMDADGDFVVSWVSDQDGSGFGIYAQRYDSLGVPLGSEFRANTYTTMTQSESSVAMDADGDFVVVWTSYVQDGSGYGLYAQRYNAAGVPQGSEFPVNTFTLGSQTDSSLAMDADGNFVIAWTSNGQVKSGSGVYAQRFNAAGAAQGSEFRVNTYTTSRQSAVSASMDADGDFVITWESLYQDGSSTGIYAQRYNSAGAAQDGEFQVNTYTTNPQTWPSLAVADDGRFVIAWGSIGQDGDGMGIYARRYSAGSPVVGTLVDAPDPISSGNTLTLDASDVTDDGIVTSVSFYRESNGQAGLQVGFQGDTLVGTDTTEVGGTWSVNVSTTGLAAGTYTYWAQATDDAGLTGAPASTTNSVIISSAPAVSASSYNYLKLPHSLTFTFNQNVSASLGTDDLLLENLTTSQTIPSGDLSLIYNTADNRAIFLYIGPGAEITSVLPDGNYRATLIAAGITNAGGTPMAANHVFNFFFLNGDANHDARVNLLDFNLLAANFGQNNRDFSQGDFNYDTFVNLADFNVLAGRFGAALGPAATGASFGNPGSGYETIAEELL